VETHTASGELHTGEPTPTGLITRVPALAPPTARVRLAQVLEVSTSVPTRATLVVDDGVRRRRLSFPSLLLDHQLPVLELHAETDYTLELHLEAEDGRAADRTLTFSTEAVDLLLPQLELLVNDGAEPGLRVIPIGDPAVPYLVLVVDADARPVYVLKTNEDTKAAVFHPDEAWWSLLLFGTVKRMSVLGSELDAWAGDRDFEEGDTPVAANSMHHDAVFNDDGSFWTFRKEERLVPDYPVDLADLSVRAPTTIDDDHVIRVAPDGAVLVDWSLAERLDPTRITADSLTENQVDHYDWAHANGIAPVPGEDAILVSMRHQDAVVKLDATTGELKWILANHDGWPPALQPFLLQPVGTPFEWQYHQHAPFPTTDGRVVLFDNGNAQRTTPYSNAPVPLSYTRLVEYQVDDDARTIRQVGAWIEGVPPLYADTLGNADLLPTTGHVYGTFSYLYEEGGVVNADVGLGTRSVRLLEVDLAAGTKHWDLRLTSDAAEVARGYQVDRSTVIPTLYPQDVGQEWLD
jgi:arylsulfate sulfotransferase